MKYLLLTIFLVSCQPGGSDSSSNSTVTGLDYSGTYNFAGVDCFYPNTSQLTQTAVVVAGTSSSLTISGNSTTSNSWYNSCNSVSTTTAVFNADYTLTMTNRKMTSVNFGSGSCTSGIQLSNTPTNAITPKILTYTVSTNDVIPDINSAYIRNTTNGNLGFLSTFTTAVNTDICYLIYTKVN